MLKPSLYTCPLLMRTIALSCVLGLSSPALALTPYQHEQLGNVLELALPVLDLGMTYRQDDPAGRRQLGRTVVADMAITYALKYAFKDSAWGTRPNGQPYSFPSGHASLACASAAFAGQRYGWGYGLAALIPAAYISWTRVEAHRHYPHDVMAGCALGLATGISLTSAQPEVPSGEPASHRPAGMGIVWMGHW